MMRINPNEESVTRTQEEIDRRIEVLRIFLEVGLSDDYCFMLAHIITTPELAFSLVLWARAKKHFNKNGSFKNTAHVLNTIIKSGQLKGVLSYLGHIRDDANALMG